MIRAKQSSTPTGEGSPGLFQLFLTTSELTPDSFFGSASTQMFVETPEEFKAASELASRFEFCTACLAFKPSCSVLLVWSYSSEAAMFELKYESKSKSFFCSHFLIFDELLGGIGFWAK